MNITHAEVIDFRQRLAKLQQARDEAQDCEIKVRRFLNGLATKYGVLGLRHMINPDTGEIEVYAEPGKAPTLADAMDRLEKGGAEWGDSYDGADTGLARSVMCLLEENGVPEDHVIRQLLGIYFDRRGLQLKAPEAAGA